MPEYRLYHLNLHSGHIDKVEELRACDDVEAICLVQNMDRQRTLELWREARKVRRFDGPPNVFQNYVADEAAS